MMKVSKNKVQWIKLKCANSHWWCAYFICNFDERRFINFQINPSIFIYLS